MRVREIMTKAVRGIAADAPLDEALSAMKMYAIRHLVVLDGRTPVGIISERDLGRRAHRDARTVGDLMSVDPVTIDADATLKQAANVMRGRTIGCLPVMDGQKLVGIITVTDLLEYVGRAGGPPEHYSVTKPVRKSSTNVRAPRH